MVIEEEESDDDEDLEDVRIICPMPPPGSRDYLLIRMQAYKNNRKSREF